MTRFASHFAAPRSLAAIAYKLLSTCAPVLALALFGFLAYESVHLAAAGGVMAAATIPIGFPDEVRGKLNQIETKVLNKQGELENRILGIEQRFDSKLFAGSDDYAESIGQQFVDSQNFKGLVSSGAKSTGRVEVKTALINATGPSQPLVAADRRAGILSVSQRLRVRDLLPNLITNSNSVEFAKESSFTNNAAPQYSAGQYENVVKAESALAFSLTAMPVQTLAHWIPVSRQLLDDAAAIRGFVDSRLMYGLKKKEEDELLNGSGISGNLSGLITNATAFDTSYVDTASDTYIDVIGEAFTQLEVANFAATGVILHPKDFSRVMRTKETGSGISSGAYLLGDPAASPVPRIWGVPIVSTVSMTEGQFLVGDFAQAGAIFDRRGMTVELSLEHSDFFVRNMAALLCEERLALCVWQPGALLFGGFPFGS